MKRMYGLIRQRPDPSDARRTFRVSSRVTGTLPGSFELDTSPCLFASVPQQDQGQLGSCGPNTADECIIYDQLTETLSVSPASRLFIYYNARVLMGTVNQDSGVDNRTMLQALQTYGFCPEAMWPYRDDPMTYRQKPPASCYQAALANKITSANPVSVDALQIKGVIYSQRLPILYGFDVFQGIEGEQAAMTGVVPDPSPRETPIGGHDVTIMGYDVNGFGKIAGPAYKFRNHWMNGATQKWGDNGYGYISEAYCVSPHASDLWVINAVPGGVTPPPTPPTPPNPPPGPGPAPLPTGLFVLELLAKAEGYESDSPTQVGVQYRLGIK